MNDFFYAALIEERLHLARADLQPGDLEDGVVGKIVLQARTFIPGAVTQLALNFTGDLDGSPAALAVHLGVAPDPAVALDPRIVRLAPATDDATGREGFRQGF